MEGCARRFEPRLLDLIHKDREWVVRRDELKSHGYPEEKKLELRLGPPGEDWTVKDGDKNSSRERDQSRLSLGYFTHVQDLNNSNTCGAKRGFMDTVDDRESMEDGWMVTSNGSQTQKLSPLGSPVGSVISSSPWSSSACQGKTQEHQPKAPFLHFPATQQTQNLPSVVVKESSQPCCTKMVDLQNPEKKAFSPPSANTAVPNSSQKRTGPAPVVGWPPIRSFRKNLASSSSSKPPSDSQNVVQAKVSSEKPVESSRKRLFVKINMDGIPIGRKVDLKACDSYEKLSFVVDELFRGLLAAQRESPADGTQSQQEQEEAIIGSLDGRGEYTLVYEDNEGDRMLVGDVPWRMFVSTVKRLRVLKSSELPTLCVGSKQGKTPFDAAIQ